MKNAISTSQATNPNGLLPSITSIFQSAIESFLNIFQTLFAKQNEKGSVTWERPKATSVKIKVKAGVLGSTKPETWITLVTHPKPSSENLEGWAITLQFTDPNIPNRVITDTSKYSRLPILVNSDEVIYYREDFAHESPQPLEVEVHFNNGTVFIDRPNVSYSTVE